MAPVFYRVDAEYEEVAGVPTALNAALLAGECDLAPISSIEYARHAGAARIRGQRAVRLSRRLPRPLFREAPLQLRASRARRPADLPRARARRRRARPRPGAPLRPRGGGTRVSAVQAILDKALE